MKEEVIVRALRTSQGRGVPVYAFFVAGVDLLNVASISRLGRDAGGSLEGFQRDAIKRHVAGITEFLDSGAVLFPNAIILAVSPRTRFVRSRGKEPAGSQLTGEIGTLYLPKATRGDSSAWIVDGQQRVLALSKTKNVDLAVPVIAFVSEDVAVQREQFVLVNKARPLSPRLVDELLPTIDAYLPRDLATRKIPSALVDVLNRSPRSPLHALIRRASDGPEGAGVVNDRALVNAIRKRIESPLGALAPFRKSGESASDIDSMFVALVDFWSAVKCAFPEAWGLPPTQSRLMHSVGIEAISSLMDSLFMRMPATDAPDKFLRRSLEAIAPYCSWHKGRWLEMDKNWNELEYTRRDVKDLTEQLVRLDLQINRKVLAA
jgi:DGQHR domain-containing protein